MVKKLFSAFAGLLLSVTMAVTMTVSAAELTTEDIPKDTDPYKIQYQYDDRGNWIRIGGVNSFCGVRVEDTQEDCEKLEKIVKGYDYICVWGEHSEISDEEFDKYLKDDPQGLGIAYYTRDNTGDPKEVYYKRFCNVYLYRPSYQDYKDAIDGDGTVMSWTLMELRDSKVIINYGLPYAKSKVGKIIDEVNDRIPVWWDTGYLLIKSPKDVKILAYHGQESCYYQFYVKKNEPYLVKLKSGGYKLMEVNGVDVADQEEFLPFKNNIEIVPDTCTEFEPYELDLEEYIDKRNIPSINLDETIEKDNTEKEIAYENLYEDVEKEKTEVGYKSEEDKNKFWSLFAAGIMLLLLVIAVIVYIIKDRKNKERM